jgi:hypothetical protein
MSFGAPKCSLARQKVFVSAPAPAASVFAGDRPRKSVSIMDSIMHGKPRLSTEKDDMMSHRRRVYRAKSTCFASAAASAQADALAKSTASDVVEPPTHGGLKFNTAAQSPKSRPSTVPGRMSAALSARSRGTQGGGDAGEIGRADPPFHEAAQSVRGTRRTDPFHIRDVQTLGGTNLTKRRFSMSKYHRRKSLEAGRARVVVEAKPKVLRTGPVEPAAIDCHRSRGGKERANSKKLMASNTQLRVGAARRGVVAPWATE